MLAHGVLGHDWDGIASGYFSNEHFLFMMCIGVQESADNVDPDSASPSKDALLEEACKKYDEATCLCPTLHDVCMLY